MKPSHYQATCTGTEEGGPSKDPARPVALTRGPGWGVQSTTESLVSGESGTGRAHLGMMGARGIWPGLGGGLASGLIARSAGSVASVFVVGALRRATGHCDRK